tara:strand:+ start:1199 stop:2506 length:1308 start_codon:yes stop_codon:yes gene_type:complete
MKTISNPNAEKIVLNSILLDNHLIDDLIFLSEEDFYNPEYGIIFGAMREIQKKSKPIDEISLQEKLKERNQFDSVGGYNGLFEITNTVHSSHQCKSSAQVVKDYSNRRKLVRICNLCNEQIESGSNAEDAINAINKAIEDIDDYSEESTNLSENASRFLNELSEIEAGTFVPRALNTGIKQLNEKFVNGGLGNGEVTVVAAPTSCGKSQLALNFAARAAMSDGKKVVIFSLEMPADQIMRRLLQITSGINIKSIESMNEQERADAFSKINKAKNRISQSEIHIINYIKNSTDMKAICRKLHRKKKIDLLIIDYLQLVPWNQKLSKNDGIAEVSHSIKQLAIEIDIPVVLLAQINREGAKSGSPDIHSLKDSGDVENDADVIVMMYPQNNDMESCKMLDSSGNPFISLNYKILKNRDGERDVGGKFIFRSQTGRFS